MAAWAPTAHNSVRSVLLRGGHHALVEDPDGLYAAVTAALSTALRPVPAGRGA